MQLTGMPPSAESMCSLYPIQETWCPFALRLLPTLQACGNSASIPVSGIERWRSRRLGLPGPLLPLAWPSPLALRLRRLRRLGGRLLPCLARGRIARDCARQGDRPEFAGSAPHAAGPAVNATQTRRRLGKKVASLGTAPAEDQPHRRRSLLSTSSRSIRSRVVGRSNTAFARKARASATRSCAGRPGNRPDQINFSTRTNSNTWMSRS